MASLLGFLGKKREQVQDIASRAIDQINPLDSGRTAKQRTPLDKGSALQQLTHNGATNVAGDIVKPAIRLPIDLPNIAGNLGRTAAGGQRQTPQQQFGGNRFTKPLVDVSGATGRNRELAGDAANIALSAFAPGSSKALSTGLAKVAPRFIPKVIPKAISTGIVGAPTGAASNVASQISGTEPITKKGLVKSAKEGAVAGAITGAAIPVVGAAAKAGLRKAAPAVAKGLEGAKNAKRELDVRTTPKIMNLHANERYTLGDYEAYVRGAYKDSAPVINKLHTDARAIAKKAGIDITSGPPAARMQRIAQFLDTYDRQKNSIKQGGYIGGEDPNPPVSVGKILQAKQKTLTAGKETTKTLTEEATHEAAVSAQQQPTGPTTKVKLNTSRLDLPDPAKAQLDKDTSETVAKLSNADVQKYAQDAGIDTKTYTPEQSRKVIAEQLNLRKDAVTLQNQAETARQSGDLVTAEQLIKQSAEKGRVSRTQGTDVARQLQARKIIANELDTPAQRVYKLLDEAGVNPDVYAKRLAGVDFNNGDDVVKAFREMVPAQFGDWLDTLRYNSMLSSPLTHAVNIFSNAVNIGVVAPVEKTLRGVFSKNYAAGEGAAYASGAAHNVSKAADNFIGAMRGPSQVTNLDLAGRDIPLAIGGAKGAAASTLSYPMRLLNASDQFFRTLAGAGEESALNLRASKGIKLPGNTKALADAEAAYRVFQQDTGIKGQGKILEGIDSLTETIMMGRRKVPGLKWVLPFVKTPTNVLKQGVEFSPVGFVNAVGATDKATALTRAAIGTAVFGAAAVMVDGGDVTWGEPTNPELKAAFRAEGKQPYAIKVGDNWVSFTKLPPAFSFPLALTAGIADAVKNKTMSQNTADGIMEGVAKWGQFLGDQSYMKSIGDSLALVKGDPEKAAQFFSNFPQQLVPFRALTGWMARMTDPNDRKLNTDKGYIDQQVQSLMLQYPGLREQVDPRTNPYTGGPLAANNPGLNAVSPVRITKDQGYGETSGLNLDQRMQQRDLPTDQRTAFRNEVMQQKSVDSQDRDEKAKLEKSGGGQLASGKVYAKVGNEYKTFNSKADADSAKAKDAFKQSGKSYQVVGNTVYRRTPEGTVSATPKAKYDYQVNKATLAQQKTAGNTQGWFDAANKQLDNISKQLKDPSIDPLDALTLQNEAQSLIDAGQKYRDYGGFTKPKTGRSGGGGAASFKTAGIKAPSLPKITARKPSFNAPKAKKLATRKLPTNYRRKQTA